MSPSGIFIWCSGSGPNRRPSTAASTSTAMSSPDNCDRGVLAFQDGAPQPLGDPSSIHYETSTPARPALRRA